METRTILVLLGLLVTPVGLLATQFASADEAYVWTDEEGVVHYSDRPVPGAKKVQLADPNTGQALARRRSTDNGDGEPSADPEAPFSYESFEITSPGAEETLWNIEGVLSVSLALSPGLQSGHQVRVYFDGTPRMVSGTSFQLQEVWRGVHNLQAEIVDETGKMMIRTQTNRFYVQQTTVR